MRIQKCSGEHMRTLRGRGCMRVLFIKVHMCVLCMTLCMHDLFNLPFASMSLYDVRMTFSVNNVYFGQQNTDYWCCTLTKIKLTPFKIIYLSSIKREIILNIFP